LNEGEYGLFLSIAACVCALGALLNLARLRARGSSALIMSAAFLVFGALLWMIRVQAEQNLITVAGAAVALLLVADVVVRSRHRGKPR